METYGRSSVENRLIKQNAKVVDTLFHPSIIYAAAVHYESIRQRERERERERGDEVTYHSESHGIPPDNGMILYYHQDSLHMWTRNCT